MSVPKITKTALKREGIERHHIEYVAMTACTYYRRRQGMITIIGADQDGRLLEIAGATDAMGHVIAVWHAMPARKSEIAKAVHNRCI